MTDLKFDPEDSDPDLAEDHIEPVHAYDSDDSEPEMAFPDEDPKDSNLYRYAVNELDILGLTEDNEDEINRMMRKHILNMVETFANEGHSGASAAYAIECLQRLLRYEPLTPLTFADDEWLKHDDTTWQNKRNPAVFSDDGGHSWYDLNAPADATGHRVHHTINR